MACRTLVPKSRYTEFSCLFLLLSFSHIQQVYCEASTKLSVADSKSLVHAFYYLWYGNPDTDGRYLHWDHEVLPHWMPDVSDRHTKIGSRHRPPEELHSPYYPMRGTYSSSDPKVLAEHMQELLTAGVNVLVVSWWGPHWREGTADTQGVQTDKVLPIVMKVAEAQGMLLAFHLEPYPGRSHTTVREDLEYLHQHYLSSPAIYRINHLPVYYVYDSYHVAAADWAKLFLPDGELSVRGTALDGVFLGLWMKPADGDKEILAGGWDGAYTYFASEAVSYAARRASWPRLGAWAARNGKLFVACVGPGYNDTRIRPWNGDATEGRQGGNLYAKKWQAAVGSGASMVAITSYNEWGEGTQIEPAKAMAGYEHYEVDEMTYMRITSHWADVFHKSKSSKDQEL